MFQGNPDRYLRHLPGASRVTDPSVNRFAVCVRVENLGRAIRPGDVVEVVQDARTVFKKVVKRERAVVLVGDGGDQDLTDALDIRGVVVAEYTETAPSSGSA
jgi:hypothetical protein